MVNLEQTGLRACAISAKSGAANSGRRGELFHIAGKHIWATECLYRARGIQYAYNQHQSILCIIDAKTVYREVRRR